MVGARRPPGIRGRQIPVRAVGRAPDVVLQAALIAEVVVLGAAQDPHLVAEDNRSRGDARRPAGAPRRELPAGAIGGAPALAARRVAREAAVVPAAHEPQLLPKDERHGEIAVLPRSGFLDAFPGTAVR